MNKENETDNKVSAHNLMGDNLNGISGSMVNMNSLMGGLGNTGSLGNSLSGTGLSGLQGLGGQIGTITSTVVPINSQSFLAGALKELQALSSLMNAQPGPVKAKPNPADEKIPGLNVSFNELLKPSPTPAGTRKNYVER
jgi:hypothetical protein